MSNIKKRLERLEKRARRGGVAIILMEPGETQEEARKRDLAEHPGNENADAIIFIGHVTQAPPGAPSPPRPEPQPSPRFWEPGRPVQIIR